MSNGLSSVSTLQETLDDATSRTILVSAVNRNLDFERRIGGLERVKRVEGTAYVDGLEITGGFNVVVKDEADKAGVRAEIERIGKEEYKMQGLEIE